MAGTERRPVRAKGIPSQAQSSAEERRLPPRPAELVAMDKFWNEIVPASKPFYATDREYHVRVLDDRLYRPSLSALFDMESLRRLAESRQTGNPDGSTDEFGVLTRISVEQDGTLHISKYFPGFGSARDTIDVFYRREYPHEKLEVETKEHVKHEKDDIVPVERRLTFSFNNHVPVVQSFGYEHEIGYKFEGNDNNQKKIFARFIELQDEVWAEIRER